MKRQSWCNESSPRSRRPTSSQKHLRHLNSSAIETNFLDGSGMTLRRNKQLPRASVSINIRGLRTPGKSFAHWLHYIYSQFILRSETTQHNNYIDKDNVSIFIISKHEHSIRLTSTLLYTPHLYLHSTGPWSWGTTLRGTRISMLSGYEPKLTILMRDLYSNENHSYNFFWELWEVWHIERCSHHDYQGLSFNRGWRYLFKYALRLRFTYV